MRLFKFLSIAAFVTFFALLYVWQQTGIFRLAYDGQKKLAVFHTLLDKNTILRYNIEKNASLVRIGNRVSENSDFQMPDAYRLVRLTHPQEVLSASRHLPLPKKESILSLIFGVKKQAEAKTINP